VKDNVIRLLLVEDDKVDQMAFERYVKKKGLPYDYTIAGSVAEAKRILQANSFDVVISDYWLGDGVSFELFDKFQGLPVIVTTGTGNEEVAVEAMKLGASDYLIKDPGGNYLKILPATVELAMKRKQDEEELRNYHERLESMVEERTGELRQSLNQEKNLTQIIEKSLNEIYLFDADSYTFLFVNEGARANLGYSLAEFMEMTPLDINPEISASFFAENAASLENGQKEKVVFETVHKRKDGSLYPVEVHLQKTEYRDRPVFAAIALDITQRKKMEQRYEELVEGTIDLITQVDAEGKLLYVNHMSKEIFGHEPGQLIGQSFFDFIHPDDLEMTASWFGNCRSRQIVQSKIENRQVNQKTGTVHDMLWTVSFSYDEQGRFVSSNGIAHDVTERKEVERAIRKSKERWDRTFNSFFDIVTLHDTDLHIVKANQAAYTLLASPGMEIVGHHCYELFHGSDEPCQDCPLLETKKSLAPCRREIHHEKLGKTFLVSAAPVFDELGKLEYIVHVGKDISDLKNLEKELLHSQKMEAIGTMAGGIAHDFNNILSAILGYAEFIQQAVPAESETGKNIGEVLRAGKRAASLVKQILTLSCRAASEKQLLSPHLVVLEALKMLRATMPTTVEIREEIDPDCGTVLADPTVIHQITVNLCTNALHAMAEQKGTLSVGLHRRELSAGEILSERSVGSGSFVVLTVRDNGSGMDQSTIARIFEPYFTTKEVGRGTGLGLAVVHGAVEDCKGFIEVESLLGKGSTFSVYLPITLESEGQALGKEPKDRAGTSSHKEKILLVDDEPLLVKINEKRLQNHGYQVSAFLDSRKAFEKFRSQADTFDLLITDQTMPGLTGAELAQAVLEIKPSLPIIMCTGHSDIVSEEKALAMGIKKYVFKPMYGDELLDAVREVLDKQ